MRAICPVCKQPFTSAPLFLSRSCFRPDPSEGRGVSGRNSSPVVVAGDGGEVDPAPLSSLGLPANPSGDIPHLANRVGGVKHRVPGPFDGDC